MDRTEHLKIYLERILSFLTSNDDSLVFPSSHTMSTEDMLVNIAEDTNFLKQSKFSDDCMSLAAKLTEIIDKSKDVFMLGYEFKIDDKSKKVMVYKKLPVCAFQNIIVPSKPLRKPNVIKENNKESTPKSVMSSFKITFLNATLKFVKDDSQMILSYSDMSTEQADFVKQIIDQCMERNGTKAGFKGLYDPLAEALKIFSLKYDFKLYVETVKDMKKVRFAKTRKNMDTNKIEGTRIIYEETTDSDSSLKPVGKSKAQKKITTLIDAITQITPEFKLRTLTELRDFLQDKTKDNHTFSNLNMHEQQFISHWQPLTQRVEAMKSLDVQGQMVLDEIRGYLKKKNYRVKVELGMMSSQNRFVKLTKVLNSNIPAEEDVAVKLQALDLASKTTPAACYAGQNSSGDSSSDSNSKPQTKFDRKVEKFFKKTNGLKNDWIQSTLTQLRNFLQNEAEASCIITSVTELQAAFLTKWQNLLTVPEVINAYPKDVQVLMHDVRDVATANKKMFRVKFSLTKFRNGKSDAIFEKVPAFSDVPANTYIPANIHKETGNKSEKAAQKAAVPKVTNYPASVKLDLQKRRKQDEKGSEKIAAQKTTDIPPENKKKLETSVVTAAPAPKKKKIVAPVKFEPKQSGNKVENSTNATKKLAPVTFEPKQSGNKAETSAIATETRDANKLLSCSTSNLYRTVCKDLKPVEEQRNEVPTAPIQKSISLTSLGKKKGRANKANNVRRLPEATVKLIEALKQPLVSERGLKMMRQMGWQGGPLGLRGEGIAEPLMPEFDRGKRAGLGTPKLIVVAASKSTDPVVLKEKVANSVHSAWKNVVMKTLLGMVKGKSMETEIKCDHELTMPDWIYVVNVATTFNNREKSIEGMSAILQLVTDDELMLTAAWSQAKTAIFLILSKYNEDIRISGDNWSYVLLAKASLSKKNRKKLVKVSASRNVRTKKPIKTEATTTNNNFSIKYVKPKDVKTTDDNMNDIARETEITLTEKELSKERKPMEPSSDAVDSAQKRTKNDYVKHINIEPKDYPRTKMTKNMAAEIQKSIQQTIDNTQVLPLLKCHGIQDGVLSYSCHNKESLEIIQNVVKKFDLNVTLTEESEAGRCRMSLKLNTFIEESVESIFNNLEIFNSGLSTKDWVFIKKKQYSDFIVIFVDMDLDSYKFIRSEHFKLYAGIDEARFSVVWD